MSESSESMPPPPFGAPPSMDAPYQAGSGYPPPNAGFAPYGYPYPYPMMPMAPGLPTGLAITGMVLGIVGLCTSLFYVGGVIGIVGLVFSIIALRRVKRGLGGGKGMAIAGLVTSIVSIVVNLVEVVFLVWLFSTAAHCSQQDSTPDPNTGLSQVDRCMDNSFFN